MKRSTDHRAWVRAAFLAATPFAAQTVLAAQTITTQAATQDLLAKAHTLESRGRLDMAAQTWQQVLLGDPNNADALSGLARAGKASGNDQLAELYLDRLRGTRPSAPVSSRAAGAPVAEARAGEPVRPAKLAAGGEPDAEPASALREQPSPLPGIPMRPARASAGVAAGRSTEEAEGYRALDAHRVDEAERHFKTALAERSDSAESLVGMGYVRMAQGNFAGALNFLLQGRQNGSHERGLDDALATARFWHTMEEGATASNGNDLPLAERQYRAALAMRPGSPEALEGLGGTLLKAGQPAAAIPIFAQFAKGKPTAAHAWRGLLQARAGSGDTVAALATEAAIPAGVRPELARDPVYLKALASVYIAAGRDTDAQQALKTALDLPFPPEAKGLQTETELDYAALLGQANRLAQAAGIYREVLSRENGNVAAWQGLVRVQHIAGSDTEATRTLESMPPAIFAQAMRDGGFAGTVAGVYSGARHPDLAQAILEKSLDRERAAGEKVPVALELQLADIYMQRGAADRAFKLFGAVLAEDPSRPDGWRGLLATLHAAGRDREALAEVGQIPAPTRAVLETDAIFLETMSGIYAALGEPAQARIFLERVQMRYELAHSHPPAETDVQGAWVFYNSHDDAGLHRQLLALGDRDDLTEVQRRTVQTIWANWAVRRANQLAATGNTARALAILNATARAFPDNPGAIRALAGGYARAGLPKQAVLIWKAQDLSAGSATDYTEAVGAALAAKDMKAAETWLRFALDSHPEDPEILLLGAKFEEARGDRRRAADYYRASLDRMPRPDPGAELAAELGRSAPGGASALPARRGRGSVRASESDLANLMAPGADGFAGGDLTPVPGAQPYLPSNRNLNGQPPIVLVPAAVPDTPVAPDAVAPAPDALAPAPVVPPYMVPGKPSPAAPASGGRGSTHLHDYVPQAALDEPLPPEATRLPVFSARSRGETADVAPARGGSRAAAKVTAPAPAVLGHQGPLTDRPAHANSPEQYRAPEQYHAALELPAIPSQASSGTSAEVFGAYVPYHPPPPPPVAAAPMPPAHLTVARPVEHKRDHPPARLAAGAAAATKHAAPPHSGESRPPAEVYSTPPLPPPQRIASHSEGASTPSETTVAESTSASAIHMPGDGRVDVEPAVASSPSSAEAPPGAAGAQTSTGQQSTSAGQAATAGQAPAATPGFAQQYPQPLTSRTPVHRKPHRSAPSHPAQSTDTAASEAAAPTNPVPEAPTISGLSYPGVGQTLTYQPYPALGAPYQLGAPPSDFDLEARNIPPLRGRYGASTPPPLGRRQQAEHDLASLEGSYTGWIGGTGSARYRTGTAGLDRLSDLETTFEASATLGKAVRLSVVPRAVFLNSGTLNTAAYAGSTRPVPVLGTYPANAASAPAEQTVNGVGGELELAGKKFAVAGGYTPYEFLVENVTARGVFQPNRHVTFYGSREPVTETELSYAGLRDPGQGSAVFGGPIWGGVVASGGGLRFDLGDERAGFYISAAGADLSGYHVLENNKVEGAAGVYFLAHSFPGVGRLNVGASLFGMHFAQNERGLTYGLGGYFSPSAYFLASVPVTFTGHFRDRLHYTAAGNFGVRTFQEDAARFFPLDRGLESGFCLAGSPAASLRGCGLYPVASDTSANYAVSSEAAYRVAEHWYAGGFFSADNTNNYNNVRGGFFFRYVFRPQYSGEGYPTGLFPVDGLRPLRIP